MSGDAQPDRLIDRSKDAAREAVARAAAEVLDSLDDDMAKSVVSDELIEEVFEIAWRHQFDDNRTPIRTEVQQVVSDRVVEVLLEEEDEAE